MRQQDPTNRPPQGSTEPATGRKAYKRPTLIEYGSIAKLTQGSSGTMTETNPVNPMMGCL